MGLIYFDIALVRVFYVFYWSHNHVGVRRHEPGVSLIFVQQVKAWFSRASLLYEYLSGLAGMTFYVHLEK